MKCLPGRACRGPPISLLLTDLAHLPTLAILGKDQQPMKSWITWVAHLGLAGMCLMWVGCGGHPRPRPGRPPRGGPAPPPPPPPQPPPPPRPRAGRGRGAAPPPPPPVP